LSRILQSKGFAGGVPQTPFDSALRASLRAGPELAEGETPKEPP